ncbi:MAG: hypothetical protein EU551_01545 [Promethearchaeota archaeon]|nr:MAG: hypothetical protein EU551_01545 [Candidatus Lokiarchaeota archaeon]
MILLELKNLSTVYPELREEDGLFLPNFDKNIYKIRDTFEDLLNITETKNSLLKYNDIKKIVEDHDATHPKNILHFTIDSLGWNQIIEKKNFLDNYRENNEIIQLSSVFPTITSTILTSIHSGLPPEVHGLLGHKIYFPEIGGVINTLVSNVQNAKDRQKDSLVRCGVDPKALLWRYNPPSLNESAEYIQVNLLQFDIAMTGLSHFMLDPQRVISFRNYIDGFEKVIKLLKMKKKVYIHFYIGDIDDVCHAYGPFSQQYEKTSKLLNYLLGNFIKSLDPQTSEETLLTITADHGQNSLYDEKRITFDREFIKEFNGLLRAPMGKSGRVLHFYAKENKIKVVKDILRDKIKNSGIILTSDDDLSHLFATKQNLNKVPERLGNVIVIMKPNYSASREYKKEKENEELIEFKMNGTHGSLSLDELLIPLFIDKISNYKKFC